MRHDHEHDLDVHQHIFFNIDIDEYHDNDIDVNDNNEYCSSLRKQAQCVIFSAVPDNFGNWFVCKVESTV